MQGNFLEAYGVGAAVRAAVGGACTFNDNRCTLRGREQPAVDLAAGAAIVHANQVQGTLGKVAVLLKLPDAAPFTVLGNITHNGIEVNGAFLPRRGRRSTCLRRDFAAAILERNTP